MNIEGVQNIPTITLNPNGYANPSQALLDSDLDIDEEKAKLLEDGDIPRAAGHKGKNPIVHRVMVYVKDTSNGNVYWTCIDRHMSLLTMCVYAVGSEIGYIGSTIKETTHYEETVKRLQFPDKYESSIGGILQPTLIREILKASQEDGHLLKWTTKWKELIPNMVICMKNKCNVEENDK